MGAYLKIAGIVLVSSTGSFVAGASYGRFSAPQAQGAPALQSAAGTRGAEVPNGFAPPSLTEPAGATVLDRSSASSFSDLIGFRRSSADGQGNPVQVDEGDALGESSALRSVTRVTPPPVMASGFSGDSSPFGP